MAHVKRKEPPANHLFGNDPVGGVGPDVPGIDGKSGQIYGTKRTNASLYLPLSHLKRNLSEWALSTNAVECRI